ncbi:unnamed protein product, partial [Thlaspi arvense]
MINWKPMEITVEGERDSRSRSVSSNRSEQGVSPCSRETVSTLRSAEDKTSISNSTPVVKKLFSESLSVDTNNGNSNSDSSIENPLGGMNLDLSLESCAHSYEHIRE